MSERLPIYYGDEEDPLEEGLDEPFDVDMSTYDLYDPSQPRDKAGRWTSGGGLHASIDRVAFKELVTLDAELNPSGFNQSAPVAAYMTPKGNVISVLKTGRSAKASREEVEDAASTADMISARTKRNVTVQMWSDAKYAEAAGWYDEAEPNVVNVHLATIRAQAVAEKRVKESGSPSERGRYKAWHMPEAQNHPGVSYTVAHEMGHDWDYSHEAQTEKKSAVTKVLYNSRTIAATGLSDYAVHSGPIEWYAECFAEWQLNHDTTNPAARLYAETLGWP